jgi:hypothetical protein
VSSLRPPPASPFENVHADAWGSSFIDVPEINKSVTDAIASSILGVRQAARQKSELRTSSLLVLGPAGGGKTHLFARLRHQLGPRAVFVHLRPLVGTEMTPRYVLQQIVQQLGYDNSGLKQLDALVGSSLALLQGEKSLEMPRAILDEFQQLDQAERESRLEAAVETLLGRYPELDEMYLTRLLDAPFMDSRKQRAALAWLGGRELEELQMKRLGVSQSLPEEHIIQALQTLGIFAAPGAPVVLVFDQLENLMDAEASGTRIRAYANLVAELFDRMRGFVIVQMALDTEWENVILPNLSAAQRTRLASHSTRISLPTPDERRELVRRWIDQLPDRSEPFPWPFTEARLEHWCKAPQMTPRMLMIECRHALALGANAPLEPSEVAADDAPQTDRAPTTAADDDTSADDALAGAWQQHVVRARKAMDEAAADHRSVDPARLIGGIACALRAAGVSPKRVDARSPLQIETTSGQQVVDLCLVHQAHWHAVGASLDKASGSLEKKHRLVIAREQAMDFPPTWKKIRVKLAELAGGGATFHLLQRDEVAQLLALESFVAAGHSGDLEDSTGTALKAPAVEAWIVRTLDAASWPTLRALSGAEPLDQDDAVDEPTRADPPAPGAGVAAVLEATLGTLRVASVDRLVREVGRIRRGTSRAEVVEALAALPRARWFGSAIVCAEDVS